MSLRAVGNGSHPLQIEDIIAQHEAVGEVAVISIKDQRWGERPLALVVTKPDVSGRIAAAQIIGHVQRFADQGAISRFAVPQRVIFVEGLKRTSVGKLDKKVVREKYQNASDDLEQDRRVVD